MDIKDIPIGTKIFFREDLGLHHRWIGGLEVTHKAQNMLYVKPNDGTGPGILYNFLYVSHVLFPGKLNPKFIN